MNERIYFDGLYLRWINSTKDESFFGVYKNARWTQFMVIRNLNCSTFFVSLEQWAHWALYLTFDSKCRHFDYNLNITVSSYFRDRFCLVHQCFIIWIKTKCHVVRIREHRKCEQNQQIVTQFYVNAPVLSNGIQVCLFTLPLWSLN